MHSLIGRIRRSSFSLLVAAAVVSTPLHAADETGFTFHSSTNEVRLAFAASDTQGRIVKQLEPSDVAVADNSTIIRRFRSFRAASESPLDLVILLDASGSLKSQFTTEIAEVLNFIADSAWGERDRVSILAFSGKDARLLCARNCNAQLAQSKLTGLNAAGLTPLYDALVDAAEILQKNRDPEARQAMILFSDGMDTFSRSSLPEAIAAAENLQAAIYCVNARSRKSAPEQGDTVLDVLSLNTGGMSFPPGQNVSAVLQSVLDDLHSGFVLTYELPQQSAGQHSVRILPTRDPRLRFRSRLAYAARE